MLQHARAARRTARPTAGTAARRGPRRPYFDSGIAMPPANSSTSQIRFAAASVTSARSVPATSRPSPPNASVPSTTRTTTRSGSPCGCQASASPSPQISTSWTTSSSSTGEGLAADQHRARQRGGAEPLEHRVLALEAGADRQPGERRRHHGQRDDARHDEVDAPRRAERVEQRQVEEEQQQQRDEQGEPDLLAVAQQQPELHAGLRARASATRGAGAAVPGAKRACVARSCAQLASGEVEEDVLEGAPLDGEVLGEHLLRRAPGGERGEQLRGDVAGDQVAAGLLLAAPGAERQRATQRGPGASPARPGTGSAPRRRRGSVRRGCPGRRCARRR